MNARAANSFVGAVVVYWGKLLSEGEVNFMYNVQYTAGGTYWVWTKMKKQTAGEMIYSYLLLSRYVPPGFDAEGVTSKQNLNSPYLWQINVGIVFVCDDSTSWIPKIFDPRPEQEPSLAVSEFRLLES